MQCTACGGTHPQFKNSVLCKYTRRNLPQGFVLSVASLLSVIEEVVEDADVLRISFMTV